MVGPPRKNQAPRTIYERIPVDVQVEVLAHVVLGLRDGSARGGHLLEALVRPTLEVILTESPGHLKREFDPASGLALITI